MPTNEQRAHDIAIVQLQLNVPIIQKQFSAKVLEEGNFSLLELYLDSYNAALSALEKASNNR